MNKTMVIDLTNLTLRAFYAAEGGRLELSAKVDDREVTTGPTLLFLNMLGKYIRQEVPTHLVGVWDGGKSVMRTALYPEYKSERRERSEGEGETFGQIRNVLSTVMTQVQAFGIEADDVITEYWKHWQHDAEPGEELVILSGDKDFLQLLRPWVSQIRPGVTPEVWDIGTVREKFGCDPWCLSLVMALTGDKSDGIPGIPGFGHKTAVKVLKKHDWDMRKALEEEAKLEGRAEEVERNLKLVDLEGVNLAMSDGLPAPSEFPQYHLPHVDLFEDWLEAYEMDEVLGKVRAGTFWHPGSANWVDKEIAKSKYQ